MSRRLLWYGLPGLIIMMLLAGCSSILDLKSGENYTDATANGPKLSFYVNDSEFTGIMDKQLSGVYRKGITLKELLLNSGLVEFAKDDRSIHLVRGISLNPFLKWEIEDEGKRLDAEDWDKVVNRTDHIKLTATPKNNAESIESLVLFLNGSNDHPELTHTYVLPYTAESTVRSFLMKSGYVQLSENFKDVLVVSEYIPHTDEVWKIKVNSKLILENGMDMKLHPQDEVEVVLNIR